MYLSKYKSVTVIAVIGSYNDLDMNLSKSTLQPIATSSDQVLNHPD